MKRKLIFFIIAVFLFISFLPFIFAQVVLTQDINQEKICVAYFTYIGCPNCAVTDPIVLTEWPQKYPNLVVIEYVWHGGDFGDPNSKFFGKYADKYKTPAAVPQVVLGKNNIRLGRIDVPKAEEDIKKIKGPNPCPLIDKSVPFGDIDLSKLPAKPKIWANQRVLIKLDENSWLFQWNGEKPPTPGEEKLTQTEIKELLFSKNIYEKLENKAFEIVEPQKAEFSGSAFPGTDFIPSHDFKNAIKVSISEGAGNAIQKPSEDYIKEQPIEDEVEIPIFGKIKTAESSLLLLTAIFAIADGLTNPCGFFVIIFLLGALVGLSGARKKIFLVGCIFVLFFIIYYFLFMALLFNVFMLGKNLIILTTIAGAICLFLGFLNIKDYFFFGKGISFSLSEKKKVQLTERVKQLSLTESNSALIVISVIIASTVSLIAILCTLGIPFAFTKILSARKLSTLSYYSYLVLYNLIYAIPMLFIVFILAITLGKGEFSKEWVKRLKLISGFIILFLGIVLIWKYILLENVTFMLWLLFAAIVISGVIILVCEGIINKTKKYKMKRPKTVTCHKNKKKK